jgi:hypothetical protein
MRVLTLFTAISVWELGVPQAAASELWSLRWSLFDLLLFCPMFSLPEDGSDRSIAVAAIAIHLLIILISQNHFSLFFIVFII